MVAYDLSGILLHGEECMAQPRLASKVSWDFDSNVEVFSFSSVLHEPVVKKCSTKGPMLPIALVVAA